MKKALLLILCSLTLLISGVPRINVNAEESHVIPIAMATDNNYVLPTIVAMTSMLENANKSTVYKYNLLVSGDFTEENTQKFLSLKKKYPNNCEFKFIDMGNAYQENKTASHITAPTYYRLQLPSIIKDKKCIYLDGDIIVNKDLWKLYNTDITDYYIAGVKAAGLQSQTKYAKKLGIKDMKQYVNAGVLLMNLEKMREDNIEERFANFVPEIEKRNLSCADQDIINHVCYGKIKILPLKYNTMTKYPITEENGYKKSKAVRNCYTIEEWEEAKTNPVIIHYADRRKPWNNSTTRLKDIWRKYAQKTSVFEEIKDKYNIYF